MDISQIIRALGDTEVRRWAHELVDFVGQLGGDEYADPEEVHEAIDQPMLFVSEMREGDDRLYAAFMHYLSLIEGEGSDLSGAALRRLILQRQPFVGQLSLFDEHSVGALKLSIGGKARRFHVGSPSDEDLSHPFQDIDKGASLVRGYIDALREVALRKGLRKHLENVDQELAGIVDNPDAYDVVDARRRIWEIEWMAAGAVNLLQLPEQPFVRQVGEIIGGLDFYLKRGAADGEGEISSLIKDIRACLEGNAIDGRVRDMAVEAQMVLSKLLFDDESRIRGGKQVVVQPSFEDISKFALAFIEMGHPLEAITLVRRITRDSALAGAALIDASYRYRLRHSSSPLLDRLSSILEGKQLIRVVPDSEGDPAQKSISAKDDLGDADFLEAFPALLEEGKPIHLEFGGGWSPISWELADDFFDDLHISIDPNPEPVIKNFLYEGEFPKNFVPLVGRAEDVAPFAALGSFAEKVVMVSPPAASFNSMILSALLAVKPGGIVTVYLNAEQDSDYGWIPHAGFDMVETLLKPDDPTLPESDCLRKYSRVRHLRIKATDLEVDGDAPPKGSRKGFRGIAREGESANGDVEALDGTEISDAEMISDVAAGRQSTDAVLRTALLSGFGVLKTPAFGSSQP
jgi:hypothetical protein